MPGDPLRAKFIAETFLKDAVLVNNVRGVQGYTGTYKGVPVSVMASGMGMPSIAIYCQRALYPVWRSRTSSESARRAAIARRSRAAADVVAGQGACTNSNFAQPV